MQYTKYNERNPKVKFQYSLQVVKKKKKGDESRIFALTSAMDCRLSAPSSRDELGSICTPTGVRKRFLKLDGGENPVAFDQTWGEFSASTGVADRKRDYTITRCS